MIKCHVMDDPLPRMHVAVNPGNKGRGSTLRGDRRSASDSERNRSLIFMTEAHVDKVGGKLVSPPFFDRHIYVSGSCAITYERV
jgi:hypothetical protein